MKMNRRQLMQAAGLAGLAQQAAAPQSTAPETSTAGVVGLALYPQTNASRQVIALDGFWDFLPDPKEEGRKSGWSNGLSSARPIAVPGSWNDQFEDLRDYCGTAWYQTRFEPPAGFAAERRVWLRFGSVNYLAEVWLNGESLGRHEGGHLPFQFEISGRLRPENLLVVRVDGQLAPDRVPPGNVPSNPLDTFSNDQYPATTYDFFPFAGIHRPVLLYTTPVESIADLTVRTAIDGREGRVRVRVEANTRAAASARLRLQGHGPDLQVEVPVSGQSAEAELRVPDAVFWEPGQPNLYRLTAELLRSGQVLDRYSLNVGIRTVEVRGEALLVNGKPVFLKGFGRHEDFPVTGRGLVPPVVIKDYSLMRWIGANSFRTSHYPYSEQMMDMADRLGFMVIDETPAVGLFFVEAGLERRLNLCRQFTREMIARDKNHPCVIMWSLANEPHSTRPPAKSFFRTLYDLAKSLDDTRPVTLVNLAGVWEEAFEFLDVVCINRYYGWYSEAGRLSDGLAKLSAELDKLHSAFPKPLLMAEFGADAVSGHHAQPPEMFSEEYQAEMIGRYHDLFRTRPYIIGEHVWNLCDFKTGQGTHRVGALNLKGVFTRDRRPKLAAHTLRRLWGATT
jgi:beta-glucuronidase